MIAEIECALTAHELIKIKINSGDKDSRKVLTEEICKITKADTIQLIGQISIIYRKTVKKK